MAQVLGPPTPPSQGSRVIWWRAGSRVDIGNQVDELARVVDVQRMPEPRSPAEKIVNHVDELSGTGTRTRATACTTPGTARTLQSQVREARMLVRAAPERPAVLSFALGDREVVDARDAPAHVAERIELPVLVAVRAEPGPRIVVPFICKAHGDAVVVKRPQLLDEPVAE